MSSATSPQPGVGGVDLGAPDSILGVITTDDRGLVRNFTSNLSLLGLDCSTVRLGRHWTELFPRFRRFPGPVASNEDDFIVVVDSTRQALEVTRCPIIEGAAEGAGCVLVVRPLATGREGEAAIEAGSLESLSQLAAGVAHEINNPLTTISGWIQIFSSETGEDDPLREQFASIQEELDRISQIVNKLLAFSQRPGSGLGLLDLNEVLRAVVAFLDYQMRNASVRVETDLAPGVIRVSANAGELKQVFLNLMINARQAMPQGGTLRIASRLSAEGRRVEARFHDSGHGVPAEARERIFEAYFTTRAEKGGTGLGLSVSRDIVQAVGGELELESTGEHGSTFVVRLPVSPETR